MVRLFKKRKGEKADKLPRMLPAIPEDIYLAKIARRVDWKRLFFMFLGIALFLIVYFSPAWPDAMNPQGETFELSREGKAAIGLFLLAACWLVKDVLMYPVLRIAYEADDGAGSDRLNGAEGVARAPLDPRGYVQVGSELWRAAVDRDHAPVATGRGPRR